MNNEEFVEELKKVKPLLVGKILGISTKTVSHWLKGENLPPVTVQEMFLQKILSSKTLSKGR